MFVERWDRTALGEQEAIIGRTKRTGAPMGQRSRGGHPRLRRGPRWQADRRCRPTSASPTRERSATERNRILRRGYSYSRGFDDAGLLDQGLLFIAYQRDLAAGFAAVQGGSTARPSRNTSGRSAAATSSRSRA